MARVGVGRHGLVLVGVGLDQRLLLPALLLPGVVVVQLIQALRTREQRCAGSVMNKHTEEVRSGPNSSIYHLSLLIKDHVQSNQAASDRSYGFCYTSNVILLNKQQKPSHEAEHARLRLNCRTTALSRLLLRRVNNIHFPTRLEKDTVGM